MTASNRLDTFDATMLAAADQALADAKRNFDEKERASLALYAQLLLEEIDETKGDDELDQRIEAIFGLSGNLFSLVWHREGSGSLFEQWKDRLEHASSRSVFEEEFNKALEARGVLLRVVLDGVHPRGITTSSVRPT